MKNRYGRNPMNRAERRWNEQASRQTGKGRLSMFWIGFTVGFITPVVISMLAITIIVWRFKHWDE